MPRLFVGNFDFEHRLASPGTLPRQLERINAELAPVWTAIADNGDAVWTPIPIAPATFDKLAERGLPRLIPTADPSSLRTSHRLVFWGENDWANAMATQWGFGWQGCDPAIIHRVNSRRFKFALEQRLGVLLPGSAIVERPDELALAIERLPTDAGWVLKGEFGGAGREVCFGSGSPTSQVAAWASNRFDRGLAVTVEPRLERIDEAGVQFQIERNGEITLLGVTPLLTRRNGGYLGSGFAEDPSLLVTWSEAIEVGCRVAATVAAEGYFGPLGIDAMRYRDASGTIRIRPLQDLNARYTMGRLALGLRRFPQYAKSTNTEFRVEDFRATIVSPRPTEACIVKRAPVGRG